MKPDFPNYRKKSGGDDQDFIESVDPGVGRRAALLGPLRARRQEGEGPLGQADHGDFETAVKALLP